MGEPGISLFKESVNLKLNTTANDLEEEQEELEDEIRRKEELHNELQNAFDDLIDDVNDTVDESTNLSNNYDVVNQKKECNFEQNNVYPGYDAVKSQLENKTREFDHVTITLAEERRKFELQLNELKKRLAISEAEKERSNTTRQQTHELLVESKAKISDMEEVIKKLSNKNNILENTNSNIASELDTTKTILSDLQYKYSLVERNLGFSSEKNMDTIVKNTHERYNAQIDMMQQQVESLRNKFDEKCIEYKNLEIRYNELHRSRECMLIEKTESINKLSQTLEETQRRCEKLLEKSDLTSENIRLNRIISDLESQIQDMRLTAENLTQQLEKTNAGLDIMNSALFEENLSSRLSQNHRKESISLNNDDPIIKLKFKIYHTITNIKHNQEHIKTIERQLLDKDKEISNLHDKENKVLVELSDLKDKYSNLENKLIEKNKTINNKSTVLEELEKTKFILKDSQNEVDRFRNLYLEITNSKDEVIKEINEIKSSAEVINYNALRKKLDALENNRKNLDLKYCDLHQRYEKEKLEHDKITTELQEKISKLETKCKDSKNISNSCLKCIDHITEIAKYEIQNLQLQNSCSNYLKEINDLKKDSERLNALLTDLHQKLELKSERDELLEELKQKAKQFEEIFRTKDNLILADKSTSQFSKNINSCDQNGYSTRNWQSTEMSNEEHSMQKELAKTFALQISKLEEENLKQQLALQNSIKNLKINLVQLNEKYQSEINENEILKKVILIEREKTIDILRKKDETVKVLLENCKKKIDELTTEIREMENRLKSERKNFTVLIEQKSLEIKNLEKVHNEKDSEMQNIKEKYKFIKRAALNYKIYFSDKEKHFESEYNRIKNGYNKAVGQLEIRMKEFIETQQKITNEKINQIENEYKNVKSL